MRGSEICWMQRGFVILVFTRRMLREERHRRATFPGPYDAYILPRLADLVRGRIPTRHLLRRISYTTPFDSDTMNRLPFGPV